MTEIVQDSYRMRNPIAFQFEQKHSDLFVLYLKTVLLTLVTLGIYSFWGRAAITKYLFGHTSFGGRPFDYHATGKEMFIGFIKGMGILLAILIPLALLPQMVQIPVIVLGYIGGIFFLAPMIILGKWRFLLSRSSYCNVRFRHLGEYKPLLSLWIPGILLTIVTLGFYSPVFRNQLTRYYVEKSRFGSLAFAYNGPNKDFFWIWLKGLVLTLVTLGIYSFWLQAKITRFVLSHTTFNQRAFNSNITGGGLFKVSIVNLLIMVGTLGFGFPIMVNRMYGYFLSNMTLEANPEDLATAAAQMDKGASALASGIEEAANVVDSISGII
jgi:uncharacterized membrane protein YjgN (DUF898 family)